MRLNKKTIIAVTNGFRKLQNKEVIFQEIIYSKCVDRVNILYSPQNKSVPIKSWAAR
jgi:hypothetical protein